LRETIIPCPSYAENPNQQTKPQLKATANSTESPATQARNRQTPPIAPAEFQHPPIISVMKSPQPTTASPFYRANVPHGSYKRMK